VGSLLHEGDREVRSHVNQRTRNLKGFVSQDADIDLCVQAAEFRNQFGVNRNALRRYR
jgi:hypothetical protein